MARHLAQHIREQNSRIEIVFVSSHAEYALNGFKCEGSGLFVQTSSRNKTVRCFELYSKGDLLIETDSQQYHLSVVRVLINIIAQIYLYVKKEARDYMG